uniref:Uncharacterized protein n=1 Tax=Arundo donax TaxID=35708 RepID=A0A0A8ZMX5_ARUDO
MLLRAGRHRCRKRVAGRRHVRRPSGHQSVEGSVVSTHRGRARGSRSSEVIASDTVAVRPRFSMSYWLGFDDPNMYSDAPGPSGSASPSHHD